MIEYFYPTRRYTPTSSKPIPKLIKQMKTQYFVKSDKQIIKDYYLLTRDISDKEVQAEIESLKRKQAKGTMDDFAEELALKLRVGSRLEELNK